MSRTGRVVERDPDGLELRRERARKPLGQRLVAAASERHHRRPHGERRLQPRDAAAFLIDADPERQLLRERLRLARDLGDLIGRHDVAREEDDAAEIELARERRGDPTESQSPANPAIASWPT